MRRRYAWVACGVSLFCSPLGAQTPGAFAQAQLVTTGVGEASAIPDRATIYVAVRSRATTVTSASADNARRVRAVMDTLRAMGMAADQVATASYNVSPEMVYPTTPSESPRIVAYTVMNSLLVKLKAVDEVGRVIDAALAKGANEISSLQFFSSKADSVRSVALAAAVADAKAQAEVMARAAGGSLGQLLELNTASVPIRPMPLVQPMMMRAAAPTPITPGEQTVSATVTGRWAFISGR
jgi:uncharacterized protein